MEDIVPQTAPAPLPTAPVVDGARAAVDAAREKAVARFRPAPAPVATTPAEPAAPPKVDMDPATLKQLTKTAAALRRAEQKVAELQAAATDIGPVAEAKKLYAAGKRLEAIALLSGNDASAEMEALMGAYLDSSPPAEVDPEKARLDALEKAEADRKKREEDSAKAAEESRIKQRDAAIQGFAWSVLDAEKLADGTPKFELCSLPKNRGEAAVAALKLVSEVYAPKEYPDGNVTPDQARALFAKAFVDVEAAYELQYTETLGPRFLKRGVPNPRPVGHAAPAAPRQAFTATPPAEPTRANQSPTLSRAPVSTTDYPASLTPKQALQKAIEKVRSFQQR